MNFVRDRKPALTEKAASVGQHVHPWEGANERVGNKGTGGHAGDTCGEGNECPYDGQHASDQNGCLTASGEPPLRELKMALGKPGQTSITHDGEHAAVTANGVRDRRAEHIAKGTAGNYAPKLQMSQSSEIPRKRHDEFARQRDTRTFQRHGDKYAEVS
ncbi:hypothetical protein GCM10025858_10690 [Alicyclobacillus sacchari]|nr:hypothetical protein [Alicyclobacillus sacchari]GMA56566.1 hypothetical protein GCM10025858_10690 [Alicyclobacillus sacchari]